MKKTIVFLSLLFSSTLLIGQYALQDALILTEEATKPSHSNKVLINLNPNNIDKLAPIFAQYIDLSSANSHKEIARLIDQHLKGNTASSGEENPFISLGTLPQNVNFGEFSPSITSATKAMGQMDVTNLAVGLTDFLIKRAKTELNTAFFKRFKAHLSEEKYKDLSLLFPNTYQLLDLIGEDIYQYNLYLNNLRSAFQSDLNQIYLHIPEIVENHKADIEKLGSGVYDLTLLGLEGLKLNQQGLKGGEWLSQLLRNPHYADLLKSLENDASKKDEAIAANTILFLNFLVESFRDKNVPGGYLAFSELRKLENEKTLLLYLGLLHESAKLHPYQQMKLPNLSLKQVLQEISKSSVKYNEFSSYAQHILGQAKALEHSLEALSQLKLRLNEDHNLSQSQRNLQLFEAGSQAYQEVLQLLKSCADAAELLGLETETIKAKNIIHTLESFGELGQAAVSKQYAKVITETALLLKDLLKETEEGNETVGYLLRYGSFMASLIEADSPESAQEVIEAAALPPGSYTIKRETAISIALNAYLGGFYGHEEIKNDGGSAGFNNFAVTAPIGLSVSFGNIFRSWKSPWSLGLSLPLVDLGAVASYRLDESENQVEDVPTITLGDLFSPGVFGEIGIGGTPLSLGLGFQYGSRLREIDPAENTNTLGDTYIRYGLSLKVDIPLMQFYARPARY